METVEQLMALVDKATQSATRDDLQGLRNARRDLETALRELLVDPVAYRFPKSGINNGYYYTESLDGEEDRFRSHWEALYALRHTAESNDAPHPPRTPEERTGT